MDRRDYGKNGEDGDDKAVADGDPSSLQSLINPNQIPNRHWSHSARLAKGHYNCQEKQEVD